MSKTINWGIIGCGKIAGKFAQDLLLVEGARLQAVASRALEKAKSFGEKFQAVKCYGSYEALVSDPEVDVVYVATPHVFHLENTLLCLRAGKNVLCEKPFGMNRGEVEMMIEAARSRNLFLMEAMWTRFNPTIEKALEILQSGKIGEIVYVRGDFGFAADFDPSKRLFNKDLGGGALLDIGIYPIFLALVTMGVPARIKAEATMASTGVDSFNAMLFDYEDGKKAILESTILADTPVEGFIFGTKGSIKIHRRFHEAEALTVTEYGQPSEVISQKITGIGYYHEIIEVNACLNNQQTESQKMPHQMSLDLIETLDRVRQEIGLSYQSDLK